MIRDNTGTVGIKAEGRAVSLSPTILRSLNALQRNKITQGIAS